LPELDPDDRLLSIELEELGVLVAAKVWNDPDVDWSDSHVCIIRSTWDYHKSHEAFASWIELVSEKTCLLNPAHILQWNCHKFYLRDLERRGISIVPTVWVERGSNVSLDDLFEREGWLEAVIKPAYGASADGVLRVGCKDLEREIGNLHLHRLLAEQDVLVQPYLSTVADYHERALVFIDGAYSHAVTKLPFMHANSEIGLRAFHPAGTSGEKPIRATKEEIAIAMRALGAVPSGHVYARVDLVRDASSILVLEVELIEPALYLFACPTAARRLAYTILAQVPA
jgi:glutathione synthase/RimK-type ligase-like ATP-grasp enzyme